MLHQLPGSLTLQRVVQILCCQKPFHNSCVCRQLNIPSLPPLPGLEHSCVDKQLNMPFYLSCLVLNTVVYVDN